MFAITRTTSPVLTDVHALQNRIGRLFDEMLYGAREDGGQMLGSWAPPVDILEDKDSVQIVAELPGIKPEEVKISLENSVLTISGEKRQVAEEKTEHVHRYERAYGVFERSFSVPSTVDAERIQAAYEHGVLTVRLPKVEKAKPRQIAVKIEGK